MWQTVADLWSKGVKMLPQIRALIVIHYVIVSYMDPKKPTWLSSSMSLNENGRRLNFMMTQTCLGMLEPVICNTSSLSSEMRQSVSMFLK